MDTVQRNVESYVNGRVKSEYNEGFFSVRDVDGRARASSFMGVELATAFASILQALY